jgi:hypothetical protein
VEEAATIWRIGDWGLVGLLFLFPLFNVTASPDYRCLKGQHTQEALITSWDASDSNIV